MNSTVKLINIGSRQLFAFLEISRLQSFSKAAEKIHLSPSGVSMLVRELEQQLGAKLFERTTRSVQLTDAGRRLLPVAARIVDETLALGAAIDGSEAATRLRLDIAATPMVAASLLPSVMRDFAQSHPRVRLHLADVDLGTVRERVLDGASDVGLGFFVKPGVGLLRQPLCKFRLMRISPPGGAAGAHPQGLGPSVTWRSLAGLPFLSLPRDNPIQALIETHLAGIGRADEARPTMNLIGTLIAMVRAGLGHAIVPSFVLDQCLLNGLNVAMLVEPAVNIDLFLVSRRGAQTKPAAADFAAVLKRAATRRVA